MYDLDTIRLFARFTSLSSVLALLMYAHYFVQTPEFRRSFSLALAGKALTCAASEH